MTVTKSRAGSIINPTLAVLLLIFLSGSVSAACDVYCSSCADCINKINSASPGQTICLDTDITNQSGTCINNPGNFNNKTLDCQGHTIDGDSSEIDYGIYLDGKSGNTIKNCNITQFNYAIYLTGSSHNTLTSNTANNNTWEGIALYSSSSNTLTNNTVTNNDYGIYLKYSSHNTLTSNTVANHLYEGFYLYSSSSNTLTNNTANNNHKGIILIGSSNITLINNTANENDYGIALDSSSNNTLINNTASDDTHDGFFLSFSSNNTLVSNTATNVNKGINLYRSSNNVLTSNTANNDYYGIFSSYSSNNTLTSNTANNNTFGIDLVSSSHNTLTNNTANNNHDGIFLSSSHNTLINNTAHNNNNGIYLYFASDNTIDANSLCSNTNYDIYVSGGSGNTGDNNTFCTASGYYDTGESIDHPYTFACPGFYENDCYTRDRMGICTIKSGKNCTCINQALNDPECAEVRLESDITNQSGSCINNPVNFTNKTLDCQGHTIDGDSSETDYGIYLSGKSENTIKNCRITQFYDGIYLHHSSNNTLINNTAYNNSKGIDLVGSSNNNTIINNTVINNDYGIHLKYYSNNNLLISNTANNNDYGIYAGYSSHNTLINNTAHNNNNGIYLYFSSSTTIDANSLCSNTNYDIYVSGGSGNTGDNNTCSTAYNYDDIGTTGCTYYCALTCIDDDGDGYGVCPNCNITNGCAYDGNDCDDNDASVNPGATEECANGVDDDCDGLIDGIDPDCTASASLYLSPETKTVVNGKTVNMSVNISGTGLIGASFNMTFDPSILQAVTIYEGSFMRQCANTTFNNPPYEINNIDGAITLQDLCIMGQSLSGEGEFAVFEFRAVSSGATGLNLNDAYVFDANGDPIAGTSVDNGTVTVTPNLPPVANMTYYTASGQLVYTDQIVHFNASNSYAPTGNIVAWDWTLGDGSAESGEIINHSYSTCDMTGYKVELTVTNDLGEQDADNERVVVYLAGDVTHDGKVDIFDLAKFVTSWGSCEGQPRYNPDANFNDDTCVDVLDFAKLVADWGENC